MNTTEYKSNKNSHATETMKQLKLVDALPNPVVETRSPLWKPQL